MMWLRKRKMRFLQFKGNSYFAPKSNLDHVGKLLKELTVGGFVEVYEYRKDGSPLYVLTENGRHEAVRILDEKIMKSITQRGDATLAEIISDLRSSRPMKASDVIMALARPGLVAYSKAVGF